MQEESERELLNYIEKGQYIPDIFFDLTRVFHNVGMELYAKSCCNRIIEAGLVDDGHILRTDYPELGLELDVTGLQSCRTILERYLQNDYLDTLQELIRKHHASVLLKNNLLYCVRNSSTGELTKSIKEIAGIEQNEDARRTKVLYTAEIRSRRLIHRSRVLFHRLGYVAQLVSEFTGPVCFLPRFVKEAWYEWENNRSHVRPVAQKKYGSALRRFRAVHKKCAKPWKLQRDDLIKYIYLAVKTYGVENRAEDNHTGTRSCREVGSRYGELKQVLDTIGRLRPQELLHMYPVTKQYDGARWEEKDYFYTMERISCYPEDKPIGDAQDVACLLWDYQNRDLEFLLIGWMGVLGDLNIYCNDSGPGDEFHDRLMRRKGRGR